MKLVHRKTNLPNHLPNFSQKSMFPNWIYGQTKEDLVGVVSYNSPWSI